MHLLLLLIAALAASSIASAAAVELEPLPDRGVVIGKSHFEYLITPSDFGWEQFDQLRQSSDWQTPDVNTLSEFNSGTMWIRIPLLLPPGGVEGWRLELQRPELLHVDLATWNRHSGLSELHRAAKATDISITERPLKNIVLPVHLPLNNPTTLYLRIEDQSFIYLPMMLFSAEAHARYDITRLVVFSMVFGVMAVMILYNLSLFLAVRDRMYLFYANVVVSTLLYLLAYSGYGGNVLWPDNEWLQAHALAVLAAYAFLSVAYFFRVFLGLRRYGGWVLTANNMFLIGFGVALVGAFTPYVLLVVALLAPLSIASGFAALATAISVWRRGNASAKYFILAWSGVSISTGLLMLNLIGQLEYFAALEYTQALSFVAEMVLLSLALADRIRRQRIAKEQAQAELLNVQEEAKSKLEAQVEQRTRELEATMHALEEVNQELAKLTVIDPLTQVANRRRFDEVGESEVARAKRNAAALSIVMLDIDHFKIINDEHGHLVGDKCLKLVANCMSQIVGRATDVVARYGGEEFALILPDTEEADALSIAEKIRLAIENLTLTCEDRSIRITASLGICTRVPKQEDTLDSLVSDADRALYRAKQNGRNQVADRLVLTEPHHTQLEEA